MRFYCYDVVITGSIFQKINDAVFFGCKTPSSVSFDRRRKQATVSYALETEDESKLHDYIDICTVEKYGCEVAAIGFSHIEESNN